MVKIIKSFIAKGILFLSISCIGFFLYAQSEDPETDLTKDNPDSIESLDLAGKFYPVSQFVLAYGKVYPDLPGLEELSGLEIILGFKNGIYTDPSEGGKNNNLDVRPRPSFIKIFSNGAKTHPFSSPGVLESE